MHGERKGGREKELGGGGGGDEKERGRKEKGREGRRQGG